MPKGEGGGAAGPAKRRERGRQLSVIYGGKRHKRIAEERGVRSGQHQSSGGEGGRSNDGQWRQYTLNCLGGTCQAARNTHSRCCAILKMTEHTSKKAHEMITSYWLICLRCTALAFDVLHLPSMYCCSTSKAVVSTSPERPRTARADVVVR